MFFPLYPYIFTINKEVVDCDYPILVPVSQGTGNVSIQVAGCITFICKIYEEGHYLRGKSLQI